MLQGRFKWAVLALAMVFLAGLAPQPADAEDITLRWSHPSPKRGTEVVWTDWFVKEVEKQTQGRVKVQMFWGGSLCKITEMAEAVKSGLADVGWVTSAYHPGYGELAKVAAAADYISPIASPVVLTEKWLEFWKKDDAFYKEYATTNMMPIIQRWYDVYWAFSQKPIKTLEDYKGVKIRAVTEIQQVAYKAIGATPMFLPSVEIYSALQKGILDAVGFSPDTAMRYKIQEVVKYLVRQDVAGAWAQWCVNLDTWKKISPEDQKIILKLGDEASMTLARMMLEERDKVAEAFQKAGVEIMDLPKAEADKWNNMPEVKAYADNWAKEAEAKGLPGQRLLAEWRKMIGSK
ncbi:MAG: TRAP transporter substrate-binding protein DctP [Proteobacteria bacterium]|nr:TRAP transporter substrate-binding protein DctP [Pseudomonadota bacterium]